MAPADLKKEGAAYDLPIAIGVLGASEQINNEYLDQYIMMGELSLDGTLQPIKGALPIAILAREKGFKGILLPKHNAMEAAIVGDINVFGFNNINEVIEFTKLRMRVSRIGSSSRQKCRLPQSNLPSDSRYGSISPVCA